MLFQAPPLPVSPLACTPADPGPCAPWEEVWASCMIHSSSREGVAHPELSTLGLRGSVAIHPERQGWGWGKEGLASLPAQRKQDCRLLTPPPLFLHQGQRRPRLVPVKNAALNS